jgi:hypothetical protein
VLLILFALGHTWGFRQVDPRWGAGEVVHGMKSVRFAAQGFDRSFWNFYEGFGFFVTLLLLFAAVVAWQLGTLPVQQIASMRVIAWALTICFGCTIWLTYRYFFMAPIIFSSLIFLCLLAGTLLMRRPQGL